MRRSSRAFFRCAFAFNDAAIGKGTVNEIRGHESTARKVAGFFLLEKRSRRFTDGRFTNFAATTMRDNCVQRNCIVRRNNSHIATRPIKYAIEVLKWRRKF